MSEEIKITKERILEAASKCSTAKATLETLFPDVFKKEDVYAMKAELPDSLNENLSKFCSESGLRGDAIDVLKHATENPQEVGRGFYLSYRYEWVFKPGVAGGHILIPKIKK